MKKKFFVMFLTVLYTLVMASNSAFAFWNPFSGNSYTSTRKMYDVIHVDEITQEYSPWHRLNTVYYCGGRSGEKSHYMEQETKTVTTTSSLGLSFPVKKVEVSLGLDYTIENSKSQTTRATDSDALSFGEYTAYYYRNHWTVYDVEYRVTTVKYDPIRMQDGPVISRKKENKTIRVAQEFEPEDFKWLYSYKKSALDIDVPSEYTPMYACPASRK